MGLNGRLAPDDTDVTRCWVSGPDEWQPLLEEWRAARPDRVTLHDWPQYGGQSVRGLTLGRADPPPAFRLVAAVPHAHEPAQTAACVELARQLATGLRGDGAATALDRERILDHALITLLPDTNSQGRARATSRCWDGTLTNDEFLKVAFGEAADGQQFGRYREWRVSEHHPKRIGAEYEALDDDLYVEPNTDRRSTHCRALDDIQARYRCTHYLDLHQHEHDDMVLFPESYDELPADEQAHLAAWADAIEAGWAAVGIGPLGRRTVPYRGQPRQALFRDFWAGRGEGLRRLTVEVRNNRHHKTDQPTPMARQFRAAAAALEATVRFGLEQI